MFLTAIQLHELTGKRRYSAQRRALNEMRVPHRVRPDGRPLVLPSDLEMIKDGRKAEEPRPNYDAL